MRKAIPIALAVTLVGGLGLLAFRQSAPPHPKPAVAPSEPAPDFTLTDHNGQPFRLSDQRGNVVVLFFGYTSCPDVCPTTLALWRQVHDALGPEAERVRFVFVTVDPDRDTPERLRQHLTVFNPAFIGLWGTPEELGRVYEAYDVTHEKVLVGESAAGYLMNHTATVFVVGPEGQLRSSHGFFTPPEEVVSDIRQLLRRENRS
ncbi:MAG: SCO family protein [Candidatus Tectimicrobiota bacterium]